MQFINSKQAYPIALGIAVSILAIGVWQKISFLSEQNQTAPLVNPQSPVIAVAGTAKTAKISTISGEGALRVKNLTEHPIRIVLKSKTSASVSEPLNWDFVPGEGKIEGLQLSLLKAEVKVKKGDIVFAFATDGSRVYWGPNIVGESDAIVWNADRHEWSFILSP